MLREFHGRKEEKGDAYVLPDRVSKWRVHTRIRVTESGQQGIKTGRSFFAVLGPLVNKTPTGNQSPKFWEYSLFLWSVSGVSCSEDTGRGH